MNQMLAHRIGVALTVLVTLFLVVDGGMSLLFPDILKADMVTTGWPFWTGPIIGAISIVSALLYAAPFAPVVGAILTTGFLGGAIATHLRIGEIGSPPQIVSVVIGLMTWVALWLRGRVPLHVGALRHASPPRTTSR